MTHPANTPKHTTKKPKTPATQTMARPPLLDWCR